MTPEDFLDDHDAHFAWGAPDGTPATLGLMPVAAFTGRGTHPLEVALATVTRRPRAEEARRVWTTRHGHAPNPLLLVAAYQENGSWKASICGPAGDDPPVESGLELSEVERIAAAGLAEPSRHAAIRLLSSIWAELETELPGLRNQGMFATHELRDGVPARRDWKDACSQGHELLGHRGRDLVERLGFSIETHATAASVLSIAGTKRAVAVFLDEGEEFETAGDRFAGSSPVSHALALADRENLPWVVLTRSRQIRVYSSRPDVGVGRKGRAETFVEANLALLPDDHTGYVPLLFSADALKERGTFEEILERSRDYSADLGGRLRARVYEDAVPSLAIALAGRHPGDLNEEALRHTYEQALTVLFRLLFVAYAEDKDLLPYRSNGAYREHALKTLARELADRRGRGPLVFDGNSTDLWDDVAALWLAVDKGNVERGVPPYNGGLFSSDDDENAAGAALAGVRLANAEFGPALAAMLVDESEDGVVGPLDFRSLSVREFGTIYEGLLESSLSVAPNDLTLDKRQSYVPARPGDEVVVQEGKVYFHDRSGARKATGSYFTKPFAVEHLLDHALEPALDTHIARLGSLLDVGEEAKAADAFFDFRCVDLAMGSGHFLVAAVDRIEARLSAFLALQPIAHVTAELERLRKAAIEALGPLGEGVEIEHGSLLRRQVARRCIYGVDVNPIAVELARLAIWIHTFVPGLPLSFLDHSLVGGDSLTGIGTLDEAIQALDPEHVPGQASLFRDQILTVLNRAQGDLQRLARISEASRAEIDDARKAQHHAEEAVGPACDLFDLIVAARLEGASPLHAFDEAEVGANPDLPRARRLREELKAIHFPIVFPEVFLRERPGFDCILGNPPWDKVRFEAQPFWVSRVPGLNALSAQRRNQAIERLREERPEDAAAEEHQRQERGRLQSLTEVAFEMQGSGHHEFAKLFVERALRLLSRKGSIGYVLPRQWVVLRGWEPLRRALIERPSLAVAQLRNAGGWLFDDVHHSYMITLVSSRHASSSGAANVSIWAGARTPEALQTLSLSDALQLSCAEVEEISESWALPWLNSLSDRPLFDAMRVKERLGSGQGWIAADVDSGRWDFSGSGREREHAGTHETPGCWRVLMTRHVVQFGLDQAAAYQRFIRDPQSLSDATKGLVTRDGDVFLTAAHPTIVFRYASRNDDARTIIASALPARGYLFSTGYVHGLSHPEATPAEDILALLAYLNSFTADWWARRFVDRHVTKPVLINLPLPDWDDAQRHEACLLASALTLQHGINVIPGPLDISASADFVSRNERDIRVGIEELVLRGFGLSTTALRVVLEDFSNSGCPAELRSMLLRSE
jgi:Eco57I restriction-modification methylase